MLIDLRKQSVCRDLEKALCEDMLKDFKPKFIILKQERPKIKKKTKYLVNDKSQKESAKVLECTFYTDF